MIITSSAPKSHGALWSNQIMKTKCRMPNAEWHPPGTGRTLSAPCDSAISHSFLRRSRDGYTLLVVLFFASISLLVLGSALKWSMTNSHLNDRNNQYFKTAAAAEAATEKVLANLSRDYQAQGES